MSDARPAAEWMTTTDAAERLDVDVRTVRKFIDSGHLPAVRLPGGRRRMIRLAAADVERVRRELRRGW